MDPQTIYSGVTERYTRAAHGSNNASHVAKAFGYTAEELASIPSGANLGLSCGNPLALASLKEGETVIDLGSGAGLDVFLAAEKVSPGGRAIGVDMNKDMLAKANKLLSTSGRQNIQFVEARITDIPLESGVADCIVSNCVVNLVPREEKQTVFVEMFRLLKKGGRVAISDILARKLLSEEIRRNMALYVGCVAGASLVPEYQAFLENAGFKNILIVDAGKDVNVYFEGDGAGVGDGCCSAGGQGDGCCGDAKGIEGDLNEWAGSFKMYAVKP